MCVCVRYCNVIFAIHFVLFYSYVRWIRQKKDVTAGTNMQSFKAYVLARDAARTPVVEPAHSLPRPGYIHTQLSAIFMCLCMYVHTYTSTYIHLYTSTYTLQRAVCGYRTYLDVGDDVLARPREYWLHPEPAHTFSSCPSWSLLSPSPS